LWNAVITLATFPGFAELKRSLREVPQLRILGGLSKRPHQEDWKGGHRADALPATQGETRPGHVPLLSHLICPD
jgi:hypothetical protein